MNFKKKQFDGVDLPKTKSKDYKVGNKKLSKKLKNIKMFEEFSINEGSYSDFLTSYGSQIRTAISQLKEGNAIVNSLKDSDEKTWNDIFDKVEKAMSNYDLRVAEKIDSWVNSGDDFDVTADNIAELALDNQDRNGTEPKFVLEAIDTFVKTLKQYSK